MTRRTTKDVFDRWTPVWHAFFHVMIVISTALYFRAAAKTGAPPRPVGPVIGLVLGLVAWHWLLLVHPAGQPRARPRQVGVYLVGAILISVQLLRIDLVFLMIAMTLFNHVFAFLEMRWALPAAGALSLAVGLVVAGNADATTATILMVCACAAFLFALFVRATSEESNKRRALIEELERTREQLALAERLAGQTEERHRIGRELHDTVTQKLVGIVMHLEAAKRDESDAAREALESSLRLAREGLAEARRLVWAERPSQLEGSSLSDALRENVQRATKGGGIEVEIETGDEIDALPAAVQTLVLRGVQEALANVRKHAHARRVKVSISTSDDLLALDVQDDGVGFDAHIPDTAKAGGAGFGLRGLRERAQALGGSLVIESERGAGTTVAIHVPLGKKASA